ARTVICDPRAGHSTTSDLSTKLVKDLIRSHVISGAFPLHHRLLHLSVVAATNTASPERTFSSVKRVMSPLRLSTRSDHLADLVLIIHEGPNLTDAQGVASLTEE
ncbi:hypothetical protein FOL47_005504, partial [Perkinsus chesapeaki]